MIDWEILKSESTKRRGISKMARARLDLLLLIPFPLLSFAVPPWRIRAWD